MKTFYFLNKNKHWQGPYRFPQVLYLCLAGTIKPTTYLWHNKLAVDIGEHPSLSIYGRKCAQDIAMLPKWIFSYNLRTITINLINKWKWRLSKKDSWEKLRAKPIEPQTILENAEKIYLMPSITAVHDFGALGSYTVKLKYLGLDNKDEKVVKYPIQLFPDGLPGIKFEILMAEPPNVGGVEHKESYGLHRHLHLMNRNENIEIAKNSVIDFSTQFPYQPQILKGRFKQANSVSSNNYKNCYNRLIIKVKDDKIIGPQTIIEHNGLHLYDHDKFNVHSSLMGLSFKTGGSYSKVVIDGNRYNFYDVEGDIIIIDGADKEDLSIFKQKAEVIRISKAIISGKFYGGICYYISSDDTGFRQVEGLWYELEKPSVISNRRTIDLQLFRSTFKETDEDYPEKYKAINRPISSVLFSKLCEALWTNESLIHAANLIISGMGNSDPLQQGALYSVSLEALTTTLSKTKSKELKPISEKRLSQAFVAELKMVLASYSDKISEEGVNILCKKIAGINNPSNRDKLIKTFEIFGIKLSEKDKATIDKRNYYLHGQSPLDQQYTFELTQISLGLHTLIVSLLLKSVGYVGHVINLDVQNYITDEEKMSELSEKVQATTIRLSGEIQQAIDNKDAAKFNIARAEFNTYLDDRNLPYLIRII